MASWCSMPLWSVWNDADIEKIVSPCWMALTRRVQNDPPSRRRSTRYTVGALASPGRRKYPCSECTWIARVHRADRRHQRLAGDVAAESALQKAGFGAEHAAAIDVDLELLEIEDLFDRH